MATKPGTLWACLGDKAVLPPRVCEGRPTGSIAWLGFAGILRVTVIVVGGGEGGGVVGGEGGGVVGGVVGTVGVVGVAGLGVGVVGVGVVVVAVRLLIKQELQWPLVVEEDQMRSS